MDLEDGFLWLCFIDTPAQLYLPAACFMSSEMELVCDEEIATLLSKSAIQCVAQEYSGDSFIGNLFAIPKNQVGSEFNSQFETV